LAIWRSAGLIGNTQRSEQRHEVKIPRPLVSQKSSKATVNKWIRLSLASVTEVASLQDEENPTLIQTADCAVQQHQRVICVI
jgi:hypothetical protein